MLEESCEENEANWSGIQHTHSHTNTQATDKAGKATLYCPTPELDQGSFDNSGF